MPDMINNLINSENLYTSWEKIMELVNKTIGQCLKERSLSDGNRMAVEMGRWSCTFKKLDLISDLLAGQMIRSLDVTRGTHVGIWSVNSPNWVFTFFALVKIGAVPVLINTCYKQEEVTGILNYSDVEVFYYGAGYKTTIYEDIIAGLRQNTPKVRHFIHIDEKETGTWMNEDDFSDKDVTREQMEKLLRCKEQVDPQDVGCMIFTSGTTSLPKGVMLSHYSLLNNALSMINHMRWTRDDKMCVTVPLFHCFGITAGILACIAGGMSMHLIPYFRTAKVWDAIEQYHCTILNGVPSMFLALIKKNQYINRKTEGLKSGIIAGSPVTKDEFLEICSRFSAMHLQPSYGQTETAPCVTISAWDDSDEVKAVSAGKVIEHVEVRIVDLDTGKILGADRDGEIQVSGYNLMKGYYNLPDANAKTFTTDGWLKTGDIGSFDAGGELHVTGRIKEMIIRAGENISPQEIEQVIRELPWVSAVKVVGVPAEVLQEEIAACIITKPGCTIKKGELLDYLSPRLAHYKVPAYILDFAEFPMNASGKFNLKKIRELAANRVKSGDIITETK